jgi:hypothetical protein
MFHVELRQSLHSAWAFNLSEAELSALVVPWSREQWIELGERKWSPHQARLTVLEGPHLQVGELSMGRGWRNAQRRSEDVTERVLAQASGADAGADMDTEVLALLGPDPAALLQAWRLTAQRRPELSPGASLALAESTLAALDTTPS